MILDCLYDFLSVLSADVVLDWVVTTSYYLLDNAESILQVLLDTIFPGCPVRFRDKVVG